ncbi:AbrB/MazE/SpoVT family DNA-binding domain-containing protein [Scleromatobacter humisilvae]|uniref:AbrB/MazE/SpoVT family DNA-binding domain-containing protein n=1 Tax=Scleromatobacter humisilvae TaxID=2897159 RepID=UPI003B847F8C
MSLLMSLNGSGAVTIPKSIRTAMGLRRGDQISPEIAACGAILIRPIPADRSWPRSCRSVREPGRGC